MSSGDHSRSGCIGRSRQGAAGRFTGARRPRVLSGVARPAWLAMLGFLAGCHRGDDGTAGAAAAAGNPGPLPVQVLEVRQEAVGLTRELPGRTRAFRVAEVRARIDGIVEQRHFTEGADVTAGELLFEIDPAPYQAALDSARAVLARAEAGLSNARAQEERSDRLRATHAVSEQSYDDAVAARMVLEADVAAGRAAVRSAEIDLGYTRVVSPIDGRIGRAEVTEGAFVRQASATLLAVVQQIDPLYVDLSESAGEVLALKEALESGQLQQAPDGNAELSLVLDGGRAYEHPGSLQFSDVTVDTGTGTVVLRGVVPNPDHDLLPGMFVRAGLQAGTDPDAVLVPQSLVGRNSRGQATAWVVGAGETAELRVVEARRSIGNHWLVTSGLSEGELVIADNLQKIRPGVPVTVRGRTRVAEPPSPAEPSRPGSNS